MSAPDRSPSAINARPRLLTKQIVVRVPMDMHGALTRDATENGRTVAQSVRFHLGRALNGSSREVSE